MDSEDNPPSIKRVLFKISGEALMGTGSFGIQSEAVQQICHDIHEVRLMGVEIGIVVGGGNIFRGLAASEGGMDRVTADHMGMLATVMNSLAMMDVLEKMGSRTHVMTAISMESIAETYTSRRAIQYLEKGQLVIVAAGTGNPFFSTDTAASLRAAELNAELLIKATNVDGVYSADPKKQPDAEFYPELTYLDVLTRGLKVIDATAISLLMENKIPLRVIALSKPGNLKRAVQGESVGTIVS